MKKALQVLLFVGVILAGCMGVQAQSIAERAAPLCRQPFSFTAPGTTPYDNNPTIVPGTFDKGGCDTWAIVVNSSGFSAVSIQVEGADDTLGVPGSYTEWVAAGGVMIANTFPITSTTHAEATMTGYFPQVRIDLLSKTGNGRISGVLYGWAKIPAPALTLSGDVSIDTSALAKETGGNLAAINTVIGAKTDTASTAIDTTSASLIAILKEISAKEQTPVSRAVTNAGTFAVQATLSAETTKVIGTINISAGQTVAVTNAGTFVVQATLAAETTKVIGTVNVAASQTIGITGSKTNNNAAPGATNVGVLPCLANASAPTFTEGDLVTCSVDLSGGLRIVGGGGGGSNAAASATGSAVPSSASYNGLNVGAGTLRGQTGTNTSGSVYAADTNLVGASATAIGAAADTASTAVDTTPASVIALLKEISSKEQTPASRAVTNAGTFVVQATLAAETTKVIGTINIASGQTVGIGSFPAITYNSTQPTLTNGQTEADYQIQARGGLIVATGLDAFAVTTIDGGNVTLGSKADAKSTATDTTSITIMQVLKQISASVQAPPSQAVTNAGTFAVQLPVDTPFLANALSTTVVTVKGSAGTLGSYYCTNPSVADTFIQIFDISGTVTLGTSTPKWSIRIPTLGAANLSMMGLTFANAIKVAATTTATGSSAPATAADCNFGSR